MKTLKITREHGFTYISNEKNLKKFKLENVLLRVLDVYSEVTGKVTKRPIVNDNSEELKEAI